MFIAIEGCIGSGKTTLVQLLAKRIKAKALLEATKKHPFIKDFYLKPQDYAFQTEMNFILIHSHQLQKATQANWFDGIVISDFLFDKDFLFASLTLHKPLEINLFQKTFNFLKNKIPEPDLVIYLKAPVEFLYERIRKRGRDFEKNIPFNYVKNLNKKYDHYFNSFSKNRLISFDATNLDWSKNEYANKKMIINNVAKKIEVKLKAQKIY